MAKKKSKEYDIGFKIAAIKKADFIKSISSAANSVEGILEQLKQLNEIRAPEDITQDMQEDLKKGKDSLEGTTNSAGSFKATMKKVQESYKQISTVTNSFNKVVNTLSDYKGAMQQVQAATGSSAQDMDMLKKSANNLYRQNIGAAYDEITVAMTKVKQATRQHGAELETTTKNAIVYKDVFNKEIDSSLKASSALVKNFGITSAQAFNLLAQGAQGGLDKAGNMLDLANEYSADFKTLGYSAEDMFNQLAAGAAAGETNVSKIGSAIKEFGSRIKDNNDSTAKALAELFAPDDMKAFADRLAKGTADSADRMRLLQHVSQETADALVKGLREGGTKSADSFAALQGVMGKGNSIISGLATGAIQGKAAIQQIVAKLSEIKDPMQRNAIGVALFGSQFKEMESAVVVSMGSTRKQFDMTKDTMQEISGIKYDTAALTFRGLGRELMVEYGIPLGDILLPRLQQVSEWLRENSGLLQNAAVLAGGVGAAKGITSLAGGVASLTAKVADGSKVLGLFRGALGLTNPVGIGLASIGLLTFGVKEYQRQQENARQSLLHMNADLQKSEQQYKQATSRADETRALAKEYETLSQKIDGNKDASANLSTEKERLEQVIKRLQELHPNTITQLDIETGKLKEKVVLSQKDADAEQQMAKLKMEREVADKSFKLPKLEKELGSLSKEKAKLINKKDLFDAAIPAFKQYEVEAERLQETKSGEERDRQTEELLKRINETGSTLGLYFNHTSNLSGTAENLNDQLRGILDSIEAKTEDLTNATASYEALYNAQKGLIDLKLGSTFEEQAQKFNSLSDEEKKRFQDAASALNDLNAQMDLIPSEKRIKVSVLLDEMGIPYITNSGKVEITSKEEADAYKRALRNIPEYAYAEGGLATSASIFGEAGPEMAIPLNNKPRSRALLEKTNRIMGYSGEGSTITYSPNIVIQGNADKSVVEQAMQAGYADFERHMQAWASQKVRVSMSI